MNIENAKTETMDDYENKVKADGKERDITAELKIKYHGEERSGIYETKLSKIDNLIWQIKTSILVTTSKIDSEYPLQDVAETKDIRCTVCHKLLAKTQPNLTTIGNDVLESIINTKSINKDTCELEIQCPRCKEKNNIIV